MIKTKVEANINNNNINIDLKYTISFLQKK